MLLVRRRGGFLLGLPGGEIKGADSLEELLVTFCTRQIGVVPELAPQFARFSLAGRTIAVGFAEIPHSRAGARGRIEASFWIRPEKLPKEIDPIARFAVALDRQSSGLPNLAAIPQAGRAVGAPDSLRVA